MGNNLPGDAAFRSNTPVLNCHITAFLNTITTKNCKNDLSYTTGFDVVDKCYQEKVITEEKAIEKVRK